MTNSRQKGARGERELANFLKDMGFEAHRTQHMCYNDGGPARPTTTNQNMTNDQSFFLQGHSGPRSVLRAIDMTEEKWKPCPDYEGVYEVSSVGRVRRSDKKVKTLVRHHVNKRSGYSYVGLWSNNKRKLATVHRLVARAFLDDVDGKEFVNHKNGIKTDNGVGNLEWVTKSENHIHAFNIGLQKRGEENHSSKLTNEQVLRICDLDGVLTKVEIGRMFGVSDSCIRSILNGRRWSHLTGRGVA